MATHSVLALLALAAVVAPISVAWTNCPPGSGGHGRPGYPAPGGGGGGYSPPGGYPAPGGGGGGYSPPGGYPAPGGGGGHKPPHHGKPPKHHKPPPFKCPRCPPPYSPPYKPPTPSRPPTPPYMPSPPYNPPSPPYSPPYTPPYSPPYTPPYSPPYVPPYNPPYTPPYVPPYNPPSPPYIPPYNPPSPPPAGGKTCPIDTLKLNACVDVLGGLIHLVIGKEAKSKCCPLVQGIADLDAALCLCTAIHARVLNINIYLPVALNLLITCGKHPPHGFQCPPLYAADSANMLDDNPQPQLRA